MSPASTQFPDTMEITSTEDPVCERVYFWNEVVLSKITESEILTSTKFGLKKGGGQFLVK